MNPVATKDLQGELEFAKELNEVTHLIHSASSISDILVNLSERIRKLLGCQGITIYAVDVKKQQLYSIFKLASAKQVIRVPKDPSSIAGFCAVARKTVNLKDAYDSDELKRFHPKLRFDSSWDESFGFRTKQVLAVPLTMDKYLLGVLQLINKADGHEFTGDDIAAAEEIAKTLGVAFYNQNRAKRSSGSSGGGKRHPFSDLVDGGLISEEDLEAAVTYSRVNKKELGQVLIDDYNIGKSAVGNSLSDYYGVPFFSWDGMATIPERLMGKVNEEFWRSQDCAPLMKQGVALVIATTNPHDLGKIDAVKATGIAAKVEVYVALEKDIQNYLEMSFSGGVAAVASEEEAEADVSSMFDFGDDEEVGEEGGEVDSFVVRLANKIITDAYRIGVSDIHVEPQGNEAPLKIRFRRDGVCFKYHELDSQHRMALVSRLKIMANLDISEKRKPQDGKIRFRLDDDTKVELRVATIPTAGPGNEDVVMRILASSKPIPIEKLGMSDRNLREFKDAVSKPYGLVLCVGPTGSGKTTTLHSALGYINTDERKIWTAEDPVEITQAGLRQVQVQPKIGFNFAAAMRAFLRADPDVIMLGEMRDEETAGTGIEASLTGHLVFSTLHTNSAPETVTRLLDMGLDPFNFADALLAILAQRLMRTLCKSCKEVYKPDDLELEELVRSYGGAEEVEKDGVPLEKGMTLYRPKGCNDCQNTGYKGRMAVHELLVGSDEIKRMIVDRKSIDRIREQAVKEGMTTLLQDGIWKVTQGMTDFKQVKAVCIK